jgi:hypothetical protein
MATTIEPVTCSCGAETLRGYVLCERCLFAAARFQLWGTRAEWAPVVGALVCGFLLGVASTAYPWWMAAFVATWMAMLAVSELRRVRSVRAAIWCRRQLGTWHTWAWRDDEPGPGDIVFGSRQVCTQCGATACLFVEGGGWRKVYREKEEAGL